MNKSIVLFVLLSVMLLPSVVAADGNITVTERNDYTYYLGKTLTFSGTNSLTGTTYIYVVGSGFKKPSRPSTQTNVVSGDSSSFDQVPVGADGKWEYTWDTDNLLDLKKNAGSYNIVFTTDPVYYDEKSAVCTGHTDSSPNCERSSIYITLKKPFAKFEYASKTTTVERGKNLYGIAEGAPNDVAIWAITGSNVVRLLLPVNSDSSVQIDTKTWKNGQYTLILQHPMQDEQFAVTDVGGRVGTEAVDYLSAELKSDKIDDDFAVIQITIIDPTPTKSPTPTPTPTEDYGAKIAALETQVSQHNSTLATLATVVARKTVNYTAKLEAIEKNASEQRAKIAEQEDLIQQILKFLGFA